MLKYVYTIGVSVEQGDSTNLRTGKFIYNGPMNLLQNAEWVKALNASATASGKSRKQRNE